MYPQFDQIDPMAAAQAPLSSRMLEHMPGITASALFATGRGSRTIMAGGGFMDFENATDARMARHRVVTDKGLSKRRASQFMGGKERGAQLLRRPGGQPQAMNFMYSSRVNHATMRPRALRRYHSLSIFSNTNATGAYTPFQASLGATRMPIIGSRVTSAMGKFTGIDNIAPSDVGPGLFSFLGASRRMDAMEARAVKTGKVSPRMARKLAKADRSIEALMGMNSPDNLALRGAGRYNPGSSITVREAFADRLNTANGRTYSRNMGGSAIYYFDENGNVVKTKGNRVPAAALDRPIARTPTAGQGGTGVTVLGRDGKPRKIGTGRNMSLNAVTVGDEIMNPSLYDSKMGGAVGRGTGAAGTVGIRGDLLVSALPGQVTQFYGGYARAALGFGDDIISKEGVRGVNKAREAMQSALDDLGIKANADDVLRSRKAGGQGLRQALGGGRIGDKNLSLLMRQSGSRGVLATRGAMTALPGLQALGTASLLYDLGKMAGEVVVSGINLAKDAYKSVQGTINKPAFGMGYQDTEAAATSRARGVMAIQNSRLNARSVLGSEAGMMAAHFG
jgi:hypothetical protein